MASSKTSPPLPSFLPLFLHTAGYLIFHAGSVCLSLTVPEQIWQQVHGSGLPGFEPASPPKPPTAAAAWRQDRAKMAGGGPRSGVTAWELQPSAALLSL